MSFRVPFIYSHKYLETFDYIEIEIVYYSLNVKDDKSYVTDFLLNVKDVVGNAKGEKLKFKVTQIITSKNDMLKLKCNILTSSG